MWGPDDGSALPARPVPAVAGTLGWFGPGNPATGLLPTLITADLLNAWLAEILAVLAQAGIAPSKTQVNQLLQAIQTVVQQVGDGRYVQPSGTTGFVKKSGDTMTGLLTTSSLTSTGTTLVPTPAAGDNSQSAVNSAWVQARLAALVNGETGALATLQGIAAALNQDSNFANDVLAAIGAKLALAGGTLSGQLTLSPVAAGAGFTNVLALQPTDYGAGRPALFVSKAAGGSARWAISVADPNGAAGELDLSAGIVTVPTMPRGTGGTDAASCGYADDSATQAASGKLNRSGDTATSLNVPTPGAGDNSLAAVNSAWVQARLAALVNGETGALATLQGIAAALNQDSNFANDVLAAIAGKVAKSGDTMTGQLSVLATLFGAGYANLAEFGPSDFAPGKASLFVARLNANANDYRLVTADPNGVLGTLDLLAQKVTVPTVPRATTGQSAASMDAARALGDHYSGQFYYNSATAQAVLPASNLGGSVLLAGATAFAQQIPPGGFQGDKLTITALDGPKTVTTASGQGINAFGAASGTSIPLPQNWSLEIYWDGGATWNARSYAPVAGGGRLQPLLGYPITLENGTTSYDFTWTVGYDRLELTGRDVINESRSTTNLAIIAYRDASGNWNTISAPASPPAFGVGSGNTGLFDLSGANLDTSSRGFRHTGGCSGVRLSSSNGSDTFHGGPFVLSGA